MTGERSVGMDFEEFVGREWEGLSRYARVLGGDRQQGEDLLAEALAKAWRHWTRIAVMDQPLAYVRRILTTTSISRKRSWTARHIAPTRSGRMPEVAVPFDGQRHLENRQEVDALLATLPRRQRAAVVLRFLLDRTDAEIAEEMGCSVSAVRSYLSRGLATLRITGSKER